MRNISEADLIESISDALQFISYYHPRDFVQALAAAYQVEQSPAAKDALAQVLANSRLCAEGHRPICQDTGIVNVFVKWGQDCRLAGGRDLQEVVDAGVRQAWLADANPLRASIVRDPAFARVNTEDNTPAVVHCELVAGDTVEIVVAAKGAGSENKAQLAMLNPSGSIADWVVARVAAMGAGWCPPGMLGIGIGGTAELAMLLAKRALVEPIDMAGLRLRGAADDLEALRIDIYERVNALGIGAQGLGGLTTVLDVKIEARPTHAASLPVALIPNCGATRHARFTLDGSGPAELEPPRIEDWPDIGWEPSEDARHVSLDALAREEVATWRAGDRLMLTGRLLTGRDAAHRRLAELRRRGEPLPVSLDGRVIYYVGPVDPVRGEAVGPAGPTTASRMDGYTDLMLDAGILAMIGKGERGKDAIRSIRNHCAASLIAVGGAAYLISRAVRKARRVAFEDLGMEAIYEFEVEDMPVTVAVSADGESIHELAPLQWRREPPSLGSRRP